MPKTKKTLLKNFEEKQGTKPIGIETVKLNL